MLTLTFLPAGETSWLRGLVLCQTRRSLAELQVAFNHRRVISIENLATTLGSGMAALAQDFANVRNSLTLRVRREVDFDGEAFGDAEAALLFSLDQPAQFVGTGTLKIELAGPVTTATRYLLNVAVQSIGHRYEDLGVAPAFDYTFDGGLITEQDPL